MLEIIASCIILYAIIVWVFFTDHKSGVPTYKNPPAPPKKTGDKSIDRFLNEVSKMKDNENYMVFEESLGIHGVVLNGYLWKTLAQNMEIEGKKRVTTNETSFEKRGGIC